MADLANIAAATAAGYKELAIQKGGTGIWQVTLEKTMGDVAGHDIVLHKSYGEGASQVAAEAVALAALNTQRDERTRKGKGAIDVG